MHVDPPSFEFANRPTNGRRLSGFASTAWWIILLALTALYVCCAIFVWQLAAGVRNTAVSFLPTTGIATNEEIAAHYGFVERVYVLCDVVDYFVVSSAAIVLFLIASAIVRRTRARAAA